MIVRVSIANIDAKGLAQRLQAAGLDGTCWDHVGTARWGVEAGATFEAVTADSPLYFSTHLRDFVARVLRDLREEAAYVTIDGRRAFTLTAGRASWKTRYDAVGQQYQETTYQAVAVIVEECCSRWIGGTR